MIARWSIREGTNGSARCHWLILIILPWSWSLSLLPLGIVVICAVLLVRNRLLLLLLHISWISILRLRLLQRALVVLRNGMIDNGSRREVRSRRRGIHQARSSTHGHNASCSRLLDLSLLQLLFQHWFPDPPPRVGKPVLELLLINASLLHEHDLVLRGGIRMRKVLWR